LVLSSSCSNQLGCPGTPPTANHIPKYVRFMKHKKKIKEPKQSSNTNTFLIEKN
jgi:hypothetical protein